MAILDALLQFTSLWNLHQSLPHLDPDASLYARRECEARRGEDDDRRAVFEPSQFFAFFHSVITGELVWPRPAEVEQHIEEMEPNACHKNRGHRHQCQRGPVGERHADHRSFIATEKALNALQCNGVYIPSVATQIADVLYPAIRWGVEPMIHAGGKPQGHVGTAFERCGTVRRAKEFINAVRESLCLKNLARLHGAGGAHNGIARAADDLRIGIHGAGSGLQLAGEAVVQAFKICALGLAEIEIREHAPSGDGCPADQRIPDFAEPSHEPGKRLTRHAVGEQEIEVFLKQKAVSKLTKL